MKRNWKVPGTALLLAVLSWPATATTVLKQDVAKLVDRTPLILVGTAVDQRLAVHGEMRSPTTLVTFRVEDLLKGSTQEAHLTLAFEGGEVGGGIFEVIGMPTFETGGRYLLFVRSNGARGGCPTAGWWQGKLDIVRHPLSGADILVDASGAPVLGLEGGDWKRAPIVLEGEGPVLSAKPAGIRVVEEHGVTISGLPDLPKTVAHSLAAVPEAESVLGSLRSFVQQRSGLESFRSGSTVASVDAEDLAASGQASVAGAHPQEPRPTTPKGHHPAPELQ